MALTRLASAFLVSALAAGCNQSLFDARLGGDDPGRDGGNGPGDPDGGGPGDPDGGEAGPDAGPPPQGTDDAVANFSLTPGGLSGNWAYVELQAGVEDVYLPMDPGDWNGLDAWVSSVIDSGTGLPRSAIVNCAKYRQETPVPADCTGVDEHLLFISTSATYRPALQWNAPDASARAVTASWLLIQGQSAPGAVFLARNHRFDTLYDAPFAIAGDTDSPTVFTDVVENDVITLTTRAGDPSGVRVRVGLQLVPLPQSVSCQMMTRFESDGSGGISNLCRDGAAFSDLGTASAPPPPGVKGDARSFTAGSSLTYQGNPLDYRLAWTVQFWARLDGLEGTDQWLLSDIDCEQQVGVAVRYDNLLADDQTLVFEFAYPDPEADYCQGAPVHFARIPAPTDQGWHFYRMTMLREFVGVQVVHICVDGVRVGQILDDFSSLAGPGQPGPLQLGSRSGFPTSFSGQLADLGVYSQERPCP